MDALITVLLLVALTGAVPLRSRALPQWLVSLYYFLSLIGQVLALPLALVSAAVLVYILGEGSSPLWVAGAAAAATALGLFNHLASHLAGRRLWRDVQLQYRTGESPSVPLLAGLLPSYGRRRDVRKISDVPYGEAADGRNLMDIYVPKQPATKAMPVVIQIHGGAWILGDKCQQGQPLLNYLASRGWMAVAINYRLGPAHRMDAMISDVLRAIAWVKDHAADYGGDPTFVALTGGSAGGHLAALCALQPNNSRFKPGFETIDCAVKAAVPVYGRYDLVDRAGVLGRGRDYLVSFLAKKVMPASLQEDPGFWELASPVAQVHADAPPFLVIGCHHDCMVPTAEGKYFTTSLARVSRNPVLYHELSSGQHAFDMLLTPLGEYHVRAVATFLESLHLQLEDSDVATCLER